MTRLRINRLFRFRWGSLFVGVAVLCVVLGMKVHRVKQQREAIAWVHDMEGTVEYEYLVTGNLVPVFTGNPKGPQWWQELIGVDLRPHAALRHSPPSHGPATPHRADRVSGLVGG